MQYPIISKSGRNQTVVPNLPNYEAERASFTWEQARQELNDFARDEAGCTSPTVSTYSPSTNIEKRMLIVRQSHK